MMLKGRAFVKEKSIKYLGEGKFDVTLTAVQPDDPVDLLKMSGQPVEIEFKKLIMMPDGTLRVDPDTGELFRGDAPGADAKLDE